MSSKFANESKWDSFDAAAPKITTEMCGRLRDFVHDTLASDLPVEIFYKNVVEQTLTEHERGTIDHASRIWLLLTFASWHSQYQAADAANSNIGSAVAEASACEY